MYIGPGRGVGAAPGLPAVEAQEAPGAGQRVDPEAALLSARGRPRARINALRRTLRLRHFHSSRPGIYIASDIT